MNRTILFAHLCFCRGQVILLLTILLSTTISVAQTIRYVTTTGTVAPAAATSWASSTTDLQGAIDHVASNGGGEVWVAAGIYKPGGNANTDRTISFSMKNRVTIYGGFAGNETSLSQRPAVNPVTSSPSSSTLSGEIGDLSTTADNSYHVISNVGIDSTAVLDGVVITGGNANDDSYPNYGGGGMINNGSNFNYCNPFIRNCFFSSNLADLGGAIFNDGRNSGNSSPTFVNCSFIKNSSETGGAVANSGLSGDSSPVLINCSFQNNSASTGGAVYNNVSSNGNTNATLTNCLFLNNIASEWGGAIYGSCFFNSKSNVTLNNCYFYGNLAFNGGAIYNTTHYNSESSLILRNCIFRKNAVSNSGGAFFSESAPDDRGKMQLINCIFQENRAGNNGGAMYHEITKAILINCSLFSNSAINGDAIYAKDIIILDKQIQLFNCVLFKNTLATHSASISIAYSLFKSEAVVGVIGVDVSGPGNLTTTTSPFASSTSTALSPYSPAINAGNTQAYLDAGGPPTDLAGNPRIVGASIDMGAYEFQGSPALQLLAPQYNCSTGEFRFQAAGGDGSPISYMAIGITGWTPSAGPFTVKPYCDVEPFTLMARQASDPNAIVTYTWNYKTICPEACRPISTTTTPPPPASRLQLLAPTYNCATGAFTFRSTGGDGSLVTYRAIGITDWSSSAGPFTVKPYCDAQPFTLEARQASQPNAIKTLQWNYLLQCPANCPDQVGPNTIVVCDQFYKLTGEPLHISARIGCGSATQVDTIQVQFSGGQLDVNSVMEWISLGITPWTQNCTAYINGATENQTFTLIARQRNTVTNAIDATAQTTITYTCPAQNGRKAIPESPSLAVTVLGNPTLDNAVEVEVQTIEKGPLWIQVSNTQGRVVHRQQVELKTGREQLRVPLGESAGMYLLQVSTTTQQKVVKVVRQ